MKVLRESLWIDCGTHHYNLQQPILVKQRFQKDQQEICVNVSLMHLINNNMTDTCQ